MRNLNAAEVDVVSGGRPPSPGLVEIVRRRRDRLIALRDKRKAKGKGVAGIRKRIKETKEFLREWGWIAPINE